MFLQRILLAQLPQPEKGFMAEAKYAVTRVNDDFLERLLHDVPLMIGEWHTSGNLGVTRRMEAVSARKRKVHVASYYEDYATGCGAPRQLLIVLSTQLFAVQYDYTNYGRYTSHLVIPCQPTYHLARLLQNLETGSQEERHNG